ncbi:MAG: S8 family serine peptidase [Oscillospiraceae bacterium]|nr:S8 family serine peptidase [Oscillospiraceae bacterium]
MKRFSKIISVLLAVLMVASAVSIGAILSYHLPQEDESKLDGNNIIISEEEREELPSKEERNDEILDMEDKNPVPDSELIVPVEDNPVSAENMNADAPETSEKPEVDVSIYYDDNNNIKVPFDEIYPEEFEEGVFEYDEETLMFKVRTLNEKREEKLKEAGILKTEEMMVLEDAVWYIGYIEKDADITAVMEEVRELDFIKVAEYNFKYEAASIIDSTEISKNVVDNASVNDQWYLRTCGIQSAWKYLEQNNLLMAGEGTIVAVIDTGVDYDHIDLKSNMWKNVNEIPDNGIDDDGNGYVDDYYGIDIVHGSGNGDDDHGHGTHVAGIIAASNNKEGIVGIAYNSKIMAVKAGQASGHFLHSDVAKAILYAYDMGADVINMSFGGDASSLAIQDALVLAYNRCILVASAGNDGKPNEGDDADPSYPAAFRYVLGVMSVGMTGKESGFSNWDVNKNNAFEYEVYAPGEQIWSTIPNDRYTAWSGTSMSAPIVSAMAATLRAAYTDRNTYPTKFIYAQIASTSEVFASCGHSEKNRNHNIPMVADEYAALAKIPEPQITIADFIIFDSEKYSENNNGDGVIDAGETFELGFVLRNIWGMAENTVVTIDALSEFGIVNKYITFDGGESSSKEYGSVGTYSDKDAGKIYEDDMFVGWENPFMVTTAEDCPNNNIIRINYTIHYENALNEDDDSVYESKGSIEIVVRKGNILPEDINEDMTLTADKLWIIPDSTLIRKGVTVKVEPGTNIQFYCSDQNDPYAEEGYPYLEVAGTLLLEGTKENPINIYPSDLFGKYGVKFYNSGDYGCIIMRYCNVANPIISAKEVYECEFYQNFPGTGIHVKTFSNGNSYTNTKANSGVAVENAENCCFRRLGENYQLSLSGNYRNCLFTESKLDGGNNVFDSCVFQNCTGVNRLESQSVNNVLSYYIADRGDSKLLMDFMLSLGAEFYCYNTAEEIPQNWLNHNTTYYFIGLYKDAETGEYRWTNGNEVDDSIKELIVDGPYKYGCLGEGKIHFDISGWEAVCEYYFKDPEDRITEDDTLFNEQFVEYLSTVSEVWSNFKGNVILNNLRGSRVVDWFRIQSFSDPNHVWTVNLGENYWGTNNVELIEKQLIDFSEDKYLAQLNPGNFLTEAPENVWPFVVKAGTIVDGVEMPIVGNEEVTFFVEFNRDMDTTIPLNVSFGSYYPYADYVIEGSYVSPRRWEGTTTLTTLIENGTQYISVSNGKAADSSQKLYGDRGRFTFEIDTTEALAMNLQAYATDEGIQLNWFQDDFDTLMGYNVYRSTSEDGYYQRLNDVIIPVDTKEFFDDEVEPGTWYYYNFTVVKTDLTESVPSGKQVIMSNDTMAPDMYHTPVYNAFTGSNLVINATVTDNVMVDSVRLYYRTAGEAEWKTAEMNKNNDKYSAIIPAAEVSAAGIEYYIEAFDGVSYTYKGTVDEPYFITVQVAVSDNDKGDVDGDGVITNRDALILLQGINDLYNLSLEEFARADINGDGELNAVEALRILQYVSGKITSVLF